MKPRYNFKSSFPCACTSPESKTFYKNEINSITITPNSKGMLTNSFAKYFTSKEEKQTTVKHSQ